MEYTSEQQSILDAVANGAGHDLIDSVAGSGKSTVLREAIRQCHERGEKVLVVAMGNRTKAHMEAKLQEIGIYNVQVDKSFRWGMGWFIFSEVMFFAAFFGVLWYARVLSVPWLGGGDPGTNELLWSGWEAAWPTNGPGNVGGEFTLLDPWKIPALNTLLLLSSGVTITFAHWALKKQQRGPLVLWMIATVALGATFLGFQVYEYGEAYTHHNLTLESGIYGSTFFLLTGFHGLHVTLGTIMLIVITLRCMKGHFTPERHFGFEAVAWYWHFVDVVWLGLFIFVYLV